MTVLELGRRASDRKVAYIAKQFGCANVSGGRTQPVPLADMPSLLAAADIHLITLRKQFSGIVLPSKVYACIASGRPILFVGPENSDVHLLCSQARSVAYARVEPGDVNGFAAAIDHLWSASTDRSVLADVRD